MLYAKLRESPIFRIVTAQFITTLIAATLSLLIDKVAALSACLAGLVSIVPGIISLVLSRRPVNPGETGLGVALKGEMARLAGMIVLCVGVFSLVQPVNVLVFFGTLALLQAMYGVVPLIKARRLIRY